ncbi:MULTISPECIES: TRAP transporter substrate-binding protein [Roseovarius]|uniref:TRAP transporter substrate-binding protein n=1 Tax=Roseovarius TaxID=74030 RepID=UPI001C94BBE9|nr:TRAP transporter substrate-binding protein [Roseovarius atlanticus]MBY5986577.1 TRAP transporter substrate-binding protein [Roseovarius atlanticus]MBY6125217.1 TRAP transporter substrate-binding protein [Roseovarius atlanticus]MBY6150322.1 TRAP transporter substrate-binding protein [Roseovarius atlanticus]
MDRRKFLIAGTVAPAAIGTPMIARAQAKHNWKLVTSLPKNLPGPGESALRWAERITSASDGELTVTVYGGGELVPAFGTQEAVENGVAEAYHGSGSWFTGRHPAHAFFTSAPFGLLQDEMHAWMYEGEGQDLLNEFTNPRGLQIFVGGGSGVQTAGWFKKEINSLDDLQGLNFRFSGFGAQIFNRMGVNAVSIPPAEIFPALQTGTLDGAEWVGPASDQAFGFQKIMPYMYTPSFADIYGGLEFGMNLDAWNALSDGLKALVETACEAECVRSGAYQTHSNVVALEQLRQVEGLTIGVLPDDVMAAAATAAKEVMNEAAEADPFVAKLKDSFYAYAKAQSDYKKLYDEPFMDARTRYFE